MVRFDKEVFRPNLEGVVLRANEALADVEAILQECWTYQRLMT
jgi:hypothetical protein